MEQQRQRYRDLTQQHAIPTEEDESLPTTTPDVGSTAPDVDPLTAMVLEETKKTERLQQRDLQYRKERAMRHRGQAVSRSVVESEDYDEDAVALQIIDKDLERLPDPGTECAADRKILLRRMLYIYQCQHEVGYRQGMHEIASYLLYVLELENAVDVSQVYAMLETILTAIGPAYEAGATDTLANMSRRILQLVARHDSGLAPILQQLPCPPQLYLTKWIRLLFSREVSDVLIVWDAFVDWLPDWMTVLEAAAAARLLQWRKELRREDALHLLMNLPVEEDPTEWLRLTEGVLRDVSLGLPPLPVAEVTPPTSVAPPSAAPRPTAATTPTSPSDPLLSLASTWSSVQQTLEHAREQAKATTESLRTRIEQEWHKPKEERDYGDPLFDPRVPPPTAAPATKTTTAVLHQQPSQQRPTISQQAQRLQRNLDLLHAYMVQSPTPVPPQIWHALADLQQLQHEL